MLKKFRMIALVLLLVLVVAELSFGFPVFYIAASVVAFGVAAGFGMMAISRNIDN